MSKLNKIGLMAILVVSSLQVAQATDLYNKCSACHGNVGQKAALGKSAIIQGQSYEKLKTSLLAYKAGTKNVKGMGGLMKGQVANLSDEKISQLAEYISSL